VDPDRLLRLILAAALIAVALISLVATMAILG
jgi:hypothetical protein